MIKYTAILAMLWAGIILSGCEKVPLFGHVNTQGNKIQSDNGTIYDERMQTSYCPPDQAPHSPC